MTAKPSDEIGSPIGDSFDSECINLLCKLEAISELLAENSRKERTADCLESGKEMLVAFLDFNEKQLDSGEDPILEEIRSVYEATKELEQLVQSEQKTTWKSLLGMKQDASFEVRRRYVELGGKYGELFEAFFQRCLDRMAAQESKQSFAESFDQIVVEIAERW